MRGSIGTVTRCETSSPASLEKTHPDLFWYGIHGVESLFTVMGTGCESVVRTQEDGKIVVTGKWPDGRVGMFREGKGYSGKAVGAKGEADVGQYEGYRPLLVEIVKFFRTGETTRLRRRDNRDLHLHGSRRRKQTPRRQRSAAGRSRRQGEKVETERRRDGGTEGRRDGETEGRRDRPVPPSRPCKRSCVSQ